MPPYKKLKRHLYLAWQKRVSPHVDVTPFNSAQDVINKLNPDEPVYCFRPHLVKETATEFIDLFPGEALYAVKCNPHVNVLKTLYESGIRSFDVASLGEIKLIKELFPSAHCAYMNPVKSRPSIRAAYFDYDIRHFVIDTLDELNKIECETNHATDLVIFVRFKTEWHQDIEYHLSAKFGAAPEHALALIDEVVLRKHTLGLSFHVGSQCHHPAVYKAAIELLTSILNQMKSAPAYIDIGGGFPTQYDGIPMPPLSDFMSTIAESFKTVPFHGSFKLLAEPGRALVDEAFSLLVQVQLRKGDRLYINDGIYGGLSEYINFVKELRPPAQLLRQSERTVGEKKWFNLYGPTCDSTDKIKHGVFIPSDVQEGDWLELGLCGAYTLAVSTQFNGFSSEKVVHVLDEPFYRKK